MKKNNQPTTINETPMTRAIAHKLMSKVRRVEPFSRMESLGECSWYKKRFAYKFDGRSRTLMYFSLSVHIRGSVENPIAMIDLQQIDADLSNENRMVYFYPTSMLDHFDLIYTSMVLGIVSLNASASITKTKGGRS